MNFLLQTANAAEAASPPGQELITFGMFGALALIFYFMIIRPQSKRAKEHRQLLSGLSKGDEVVSVDGDLAPQVKTPDTAGQT